MKNTIDYKSRFRILKGGRISHVVSALLVGSLVNVAEAASYVIDSNTTAQTLLLTEASSISVIGDLNVTNASPALDITTAGYVSAIDITDSGSITAGDTGKQIGIYISDYMYSTSSITNSGTISTISADNSAFGIYAMGMDDNSSIINSGTINATSDTGGSYGIYIGPMSGDSSITNSGDINVTTVSGRAHAIKAWNMYDDSSITNSGTISATGAGNSEEYGISVNYMYGTSSIINSGTINAISASSAANGIYAYNMYNESSITNTGTINVTSVSGEARGIYATHMYDDTSIINSGTITATINGVADADAFSLYLDSMAAGASVTNDSTGVLNGNINVQGSMSNAGLISLSYNANSSNRQPYIKDFTNESTGTLEIGLNTAADGVVTNKYSQLDTDTVVFEDGSTINVNVLTISDNQSLIVDQNLNNVVSSNALTINGTLNITDNSALLNFEYVEDGETIDLQVVEGSSILDSTIAGDGDINTQEAAAALDSINDSDNTDMDSVFTELNTLTTDTEVATAVKSTTSLIASASVEAGIQVMNGMQSIVDMRQSVNIESGINSGDSLLSDKNFWFKPFASTGSQDDNDGVNGFALRTGGFGMGVDGEYASNQRVGLALFYTNAKVNVNSVNQSSELDVFSVLVYGNIPIIDDKTNFLYQIGYALQETESSRGVFTGDTAKADYTSTTASLDLKLMRNYELNDSFVFQPIVQATYRHANNPTYNEIGAGVLNLHVDKFSTDELIAGVGSMVHYSVSNDSKIIANINLGYDLNNDTETVTAAYQGALGTTFDTYGIDNGRFNYEIGVGYEMSSILGGELNFMYNYQAQGSSFRNNTFSAKYVLKF